MSQPAGQAARCYAVLIAPIVLAVALTPAGVPVPGMLVVASVIGGLGTLVGLFILLGLARYRQIMGNRPIPGRLAAGGWLIVVNLCILWLMFIGSAVSGLGWSAPRQPRLRALSFRPRGWLVPTGRPILRAGWQIEPQFDAAAERML